MSYDLVLTLIILGVAVALFLSDRLRADLVALLTMVALGTTGILDSQETFSGFSRGAVITLLAIFMLTAGLERTGVTRRVGRILVRLAGSSEPRLVVTVMGVGAFLSLFMNNIAAAAVLLPAVSGASRRTGVPPSRLLLPLAFGTLLGGMATLLTTTNIVVGSLLRDHGEPGFGLFDFLPVGLPLGAAGILYMVFWGRHRLPDRSPGEEMAALHRQEADLAEVYRLGEALFRGGVPAKSPLVGKTLAESGFRERFGWSVLAIERSGRMLQAPVPDTKIEAEDVLVLSGEPGAAPEPGLEILPARQWRERDLESRSVAVVEAVLSPRSTLIGQTLRDSQFRDRFGMTVMAVWRGGKSLRTGLPELALQLGDALLLQGDRGRLAGLRAEPDLILLDRPDDEIIPPPRRQGWMALAVMVGTLALAASGLLPVAEVMMGGALAMVLTGALNMDQAYRAIEWKSVFLVAGMLPMGLALTKTGAAALITQELIELVGDAAPWVLFAGLVLLALLLTQAMNGAAVAAIVAPVAIKAAQQTGADPHALAMGVALATSMAFLTPLGHPVNTLVMGPGGYRFRDYVRVGLPLTAILFGLIVLLVPLWEKWLR